MKKLIIRNSNGWTVLILFLLTNLVYTFMLTVTIPKVMSFSGGRELLDMIPTGYQPDYVAGLLTALGEQGRHAYLFNQIPPDMIYPFLFGVSYCLLFAFILKKLNKTDGPFFWFCFLPLFAGIFDYCENIGIIALLTSYPDFSIFLAKLTNVFSILKSTFTTLYFVVLLIFVMIFVVRKLSPKQIKQP